MVNNKTRCAECPGLKQNFLSPTTESSIESICPMRTLTSYKKGQLIYLENTPSFGFYCLNAGNVKIVTTDKRGKKSIVSIVKAGEFFGHSNLFVDVRHYASAIALESCSVCFFTKDIVSNLVIQHPIIALNLLSSLSSSLIQAYTQDIFKFQLNTREKLVHLLLSLIQSHGIKNNDTYRINLHLTREEYGSIMGETSV